MAISSYTELQAAVANRMNRTDLTTIIQDAIAAAEAEFNRILRDPRQIVVDSAFVCSSRYQQLPADFLSMECVQFPSGASGPAGGYSVVGSKLAVVPDPSLHGAVTLEIRYYGKIPALTAGSPTNWLLALHPDLYLYRSCIETAQYMQDEGRLQLYSGLYTNVLPAVQLAGDYFQYGAAPSMRAG